MKLIFQVVNYASNAIRMLNDAKISVRGVCSIEGANWFIAVKISFSSTTA